MFTIEDGREHFYQWDINRRIRVDDPTITEVHFCNRTDECSLVVNTYTDDTYDGKVYADVPNILLQDTWNIRVYAYCTNYTKIEEIFKVKARTKPSDYAYTETEVKTYEYLDKKLTEIEEKGFSEETVNKAVDEHFTNNPISIYFNNDEEGNVEVSIDTIPNAEEVSY